MVEEITQIFILNYHEASSSLSFMEPTKAQIKQASVATKDMGPGIDKAIVALLSPLVQRGQIVLKNILREK
jgi:hypothetical protein